MRLGELFAGYGGLGMAVEEVFGAETAWFSEFEEAPSKILAHHWPHVPNHGDITKIDWLDVEPVDIISGGSPCQDLSLAGKRRGMQDGTRSNLWETMREGIAIIKPKYVVWENVKGALSAGAVSELEQSEGCLGEGGNPNLRAIGRVLGDLADLGFDAEWRGLRAADVGACHGRFRVFILASHRDRQGLQVTGNSGIPHQEGLRTSAATVRNTLPAPHRDHLGSYGARVIQQEARRGEPAHSDHTDWGRYERAIRSWERSNGAAPRPTEHSGRGHLRLSASFAEWMMNLPRGWVTDVPGITRSAQIKALGNGVVPAQAKAALSDMLAAFELQDRKAA